MKPTVKTHEATERITTESLEVGPGVHVQRIRAVRQELGAETETVTERVEGPPQEGEYPGHFYVVEPELLENLRVTGWLGDFKLVSETPFTRCTSGKPYRVVRLKSYDHTLYDLDGLPLPVGLHFDYMGGSVNNRSFRLEPMLTALEARDDCQIATERYGKQKVQSVPHYNSGDGSGTRFVQFTWGPSVELYREYRKLVAAAGPEVWDARHTVALTMMGLDQYRLPKRDSEDSDDE